MQTEILRGIINLAAVVALKIIIATIVAVLMLGALWLMNELFQRVLKDDAGAGRKKGKKRLGKQAHGDNALDLLHALHSYGFIYTFGFYLCLEAIVNVRWALSGLSVWKS